MLVAPVLIRLFRGAKIENFHGACSPYLHDQFISPTAPSPHLPIAPSPLRPKPGCGFLLIDWLNFKIFLLPLQSVSKNGCIINHLF